MLDSKLVQLQLLAVMSHQDIPVSAIKTVAISIHTDLVRLNFLDQVQNSLSTLTALSP